MELDLAAAIKAATIPSITLLGCVTAHVYSEQKGFKSGRKYLKQFFPKKTTAFYIRLEFILSAILGTCIGIILYSPSTPYQALAAGVGWTAAFNLTKAEKIRERAATQSAAEEIESGKTDDC